MADLHDSLLNQLGATHSGEPWYGTSRLSFLKGVTASQAAAHPIPGARSVWEQILHMTSWTSEVTQRLNGGVPGSPADGDWPSVSKTTPAAWNGAKTALTEAHGELLMTIAAMPKSRWSERLATGATVGEMLIGLAQHDAFHIGQMALTLQAGKKR